MNKKAQVSIFIIVGIVIVVGIILFFVIRSGIGTKSLPADLEPAYQRYVSCLEDVGLEGTVIMGQQGGYIDLPDYEAGSAYRPFSSQLDFFGSAVPYWMYVSGNNIVRTQVPTKNEMEEDLANYVKTRIKNCYFEDLEEAGYDVYLGDIQVVADIKDYSVELEVDSPVTIFRGDSSGVVEDHLVEINSKLGKFYESALKIYNFEQEELFLEEYALDVMRLYAPVTGVELTCTPKVFVDELIYSNITRGLFDNVASIKVDGSYYSLSSSDRDYFVAGSGLDIDESVNFMYLEDWPTKIEMYGDRVVTPVGLQEGMGVLGFCYVPYHFVYDIDFPVMVQLFDGEEFFQFPMAVIISKSQPRQHFSSLEGYSLETDACEFREKEITVNTYDFDLNPVEARIQYKCLDSTCEIGNTKVAGGSAVLSGDFPACVGGFIIASATGYADFKKEFSSNEGEEINIIMKKKHELYLDLGEVDSAWVSFESEDYNDVALYPEDNIVELVEGNYEVLVQVYDDSSLKFPEVNQRKCVDVPESGLAGFLGAQTQKCYDIILPEMDVDFAVVGGGRTNEFFSEQTLLDSLEIDITVPLFGIPNSIEGLQENFAKSEAEEIFLSFA